MNYNDITLFSVMKQKMSYLGERQAVLAQNVANADTPGYKAQDIKAPNFGSMVQQRLALVATSPRHMQVGGGGSSQFKAHETKPTWETTPTENTVALDEEMKKIGMNQAEYQQVTTLYRKTVDMFKTAIGRPGAV